MKNGDRRVHHPDRYLTHTMGGKRVGLSDVHGSVSLFEQHCQRVRKREEAAVLDCGGVRVRMSRGRVLDGGRGWNVKRVMRSIVQEGMVI
jgi:hypothetical protein